MTILALILMIWITIGVGVILLLNAAKWTVQELARSDSSQPQLQHPWTAPSLARSDRS